MCSHKFILSQKPKDLCPNEDRTEFYMVDANLKTGAHATTTSLRTISNTNRRVERTAGWILPQAAHAADADALRSISPRDCGRVFATPPYAYAPIRLPSGANEAGPVFKIGWSGKNWR
jgi:hypothetical protein